MFSIYHHASGRRNHLTRRELLRVGGLSLFGLGQSDLVALRAAEPRRRQNACVLLFLFGGPSHIDLWDMKPAAPAEIRGGFRPAATSVPGIQICEHLPQLAAVMNRVCLVRSMTHQMNVHGPACSEIFSGRPYFGPPTTDQASREDWPALSALVMRYAAGRGGVPPSVVLPWYLQFPGQARRIAGQTGGRMGEHHNALLLQGDLASADFELEGLRLASGMSVERLQGRVGLLDRLENRRRFGAATAALDRNCRIVNELLANQASAAFELRREPAAVRQRYGATTVGQSLLLARRLVERGVALVTVNWQDETRIDGVNTCWDTHQNNFAKLRDLLCPLFDRAFSAFVDDLAQRGLLETTLVVAVGEFGRTPRLGQFSQSSNTQKTGRDHWAHAFTALLAGGGVRGGQVYGATTSDGGYVDDQPVTPADLTATVLHHLGIDFTQQYQDAFQRRRHPLSEGRVVDLG